LLKAFNPNEAQILDDSTNSHIRFRLGGEKFPPTVYYKIYVHGALCDIGSFAPRDYAAINRSKGPTEKMYYKDFKDQKVWHDGWYLREENNGWRPLEVKQTKKKDYIETITSQKVKYHHHNGEYRQKKKEKQRRLNKLRWFQTMFEKAKEQEPILQGQPNPFEESKFFDLNEEHFEKEVNDLIEWSENLDFDQYVDNWTKLSTSNQSNFVSGLRNAYVNKVTHTHMENVE